ncbi:hypothetical protein [Streptomyces sp. NPDC001652]|uniref:hypothetical protein n=1 Tax=Streptomyces sp. NPDC001652 TaxID=3154393 RepID=UPI003325203D
MPIVFVHGVATRRLPGYVKSEAARAALMRCFLMPAMDQASFFAPYWGGRAAVFAWEHASLPEGDEEVFGPGEETPAILLGEVWESEPPPDDRVVLQVARNSFADGIDLLFGTAAVDVDPEEADGFARLAVRAAQLTRPAWLDTARNDDEVINRLAEDLGGSTSEEEVFGPDQALARVYEGLSRIRGAAGRMAGRLAVKALRPSLNRSASMFLGDILVYLRQREQLGADGPIVTTIATDLHRAREACTADDPQLIVIAHSMGGNIVYDLLSDLRPDLSCDVLVTVGSQIGVFAELGLFDAVPAPANPATDRIPKPPGVGRWINVFDLNDILGFATERIFDGVRDFRYSTGKGAFAAHSTYFVRPSFYDRLAARLGEAS